MSAGARWSCAQTGPPRSTARRAAQHLGAPAQAIDLDVEASATARATSGARTRATASVISPSSRSATGCGRSGRAAGDTPACRASARSARRTRREHEPIATTATPRDLQGRDASAHSNDRREGVTMGTQGSALANRARRGHIGGALQRTGSAVAAKQRVEERAVLSSSSLNSTSAGDPVFVSSRSTGWDSGEKYSGWTGLRYRVEQAQQLLRRGRVVIELAQHQPPPPSAVPQAQHLGTARETARHIFARGSPHAAHVVRTAAAIASAQRNVRPPPHPTRDDPGGEEASKSASNSSTAWPCSVGGKRARCPPGPRGASASRSATTGAAG